MNEQQVKENRSKVRDLEAKLDLLLSAEPMDQEAAYRILEEWLRLEEAWKKHLLN